MPLRKTTESSNATATAVRRPSTMGYAGYSWGDASIGSAGRRASDGADAVRAILVDGDGRFIERVRRKVLGTSIALTVIPDEAGLETAVVSRRPQVILLARDKAHGIGQLARIPAFKDRHPGVGVVMVADPGGATEAEDKVARRWGTLGVVSRDRLLHGATLPEVIRAAARQGTPGPSRIRRG